jgi:adenylate kinase
MLDGFPRTIAQAEALDKIADIQIVINIDVDHALLMDRLCGRRVCKDCGESYHLSRLNGATTCSRCGGELYQRKDDNPETVQKRLGVYNAQTAPLIDYYKEQGKLESVDGMKKIDEVFEEISKVLNK